ncbi:hypothetical protein BC937DRAFT_90547 [Endogone sp. FLAS-F59071]|nr:hypothetical protein BC937DRAFT_90547 [Endogone sp. FLAS-F59071]|eukprot:RUS17002.1 hypothetical protein BC937DRAFT_90547 [Endogone sp. FLAS-F59071]
MPVRCHVVIACIHDGFVAGADVKHGGAEDVTSVVGLDFELIVHVESLVKIDSDDFFHAILDHLGGEEVGIALTLEGDLAVVLEEDGTDGLGRVGHIDGPLVAAHFREERQGATVVEMKVADNDAVESVGELASFRDIAEIGEAAFVIVTHVHAAIEHNVLITD